MSSTEDETDSDNEYGVALGDVKLQGGITHDDFQLKWAEQRGLCRASGLPMLMASNTIYSVKVAPRCTKSRLDKHNFVLVTKIMADMREASGLPWKAFSLFLQHNVCLSF